MKKLLIIEDDPILLKMYSKKFDSSGFKTFTALDGEAGIEEAKKQLPDFIILDLIMPKIDGNEVLKRLKSQPDTQNIPVALLTVVQEDVAVKNNPDLFKNIVAYWRKDQLTPAQVIENIENFLK